MYISTKDDETNFAWHFDGPVDILLDSKRVFGCLEADDVEGYIVVASRDEKGEIIAVDGEIQTERKEGKVEIIGERRNVA